MAASALETTAETDTESISSNGNGAVAHSNRTQFLLDFVVWQDPKRMGGTPCFRGTRVPIKHLWDYLEGDDLLEGFKGVDSRLRHYVTGHDVYTAQFMGRENLQK